MREAGFRSFLGGRIGAPSVNSYVSYCGRVERDLGLDLDVCDLSPVGVSNIARRLAQSGAPPASVRNCLSAIRSYAEFRGGAAVASGTSSPAAPMRVTRAQREAWAETTAKGPFNRWLDARVRNENGQFDLKRLYALAARYGVALAPGQDRLNSGQQRMNLGNRLRRVVPASEYDAEPFAQVAPPGPLPAAEMLPPFEPAPRPELVTGASVRDLLLLYGQIMDELRVRGVVRTGNSPVGDYAELLFAKAFGWDLEGNSSAGHDARDAAGLRYQIKARRLSSPAASRQLSAIRRLHDNTFDYLAAVLFDSTFKVLRAVIVPHDLVVGRARRREHTNSWLFMLEDRVWLSPGARDVTAEIAVAASQI